MQLILPYLENLEVEPSSLLLAYVESGIDGLDTNELVEGVRKGSGNSNLPVVICGPLGSLHAGSGAHLPRALRAVQQFP